MIATNNTAIDNFIIQVKLIDPIEKILVELEKGKFRDCDIKWLDEKLDAFMVFAAKTLGMNPIGKAAIPSGLIKPSVMNEHMTKYYQEHFKKLLDYFITFKD